jgi:hypothetical protein
MWETKHLTTLQSSMVCYGNSCAILLYLEVKICTCGGRLTIIAICQALGGTTSFMWVHTCGLLHTFSATLMRGGIGHYHCWPVSDISRLQNVAKCVQWPMRRNKKRSTIHCIDFTHVEQKQNGIGESTLAPEIATIHSADQRTCPIICLQITDP